MFALETLTHNRAAWRALALVAVVAASGAASHLAHGASIDYLVWRSVGSTGTLDEKNSDLAKMSEARVEMQGSSDGSIKLRYPVNLPKTWSASASRLRIENAWMKVSFLDDSDQGEVIVMLKRYNSETGETDTLLTFESDEEAAASADYQFAWMNKAYPTGWGVRGYDSLFIEAKLIKDDPDANVGLAAVELWIEER